MGRDKKKNGQRERHSAFFQNTECEYFPCHDTDRTENFNCLFCYCPLYALGRKCGGNFRYTESGIKDCTGCLLPHEKENYGLITGRFSEIRRVVSLMDRAVEPGVPPAGGGMEAADTLCIAENVRFIRRLQGDNRKRGCPAAPGSRGN